MNNIKIKLEELEEIEKEIEVYRAKYEQKEVTNQLDLLKNQLEKDFLDPIIMFRDQLEKEIKSRKDRQSTNQPD